MRAVTVKVEELKEFLEKQKIATMHELKVVLGTNASMTIFRKLAELTYVSSYSHRGKYYAIKKGIIFDKQGLWSYDGVYFSRFGTLLETVKVFINHSEKGYSATELKDMLSVEVKEPLLNLVQKKQIVRKKLERLYVYFSSRPGIRRRQEILRKKSIPEANELKAAIILFFSLLDEKQKRIYAGLESLKIGYGGDSKIASILGLHANTIAQGRKELLVRDVEIDGARKQGGGRKAIKKNP
jgi:hypothetical protein